MLGDVKVCISDRVSSALLMVLNWFSFGGKLKAYNIWKPFATGNQRGIEIVLYEGLQGSQFSLEWDIFRFPIY